MYTIKTLYKVVFINVRKSVFPSDIIKLLNYLEYENKR